MTPDDVCAEIAALFESIGRLAPRDPLTTVANRFHSMPRAAHVSRLAR